MQKRAFTLIELLVTVMIIGLLTTVATASFVNAQRSSRDDARKANVQVIATALEAYKLVYQKYPGITAPADTANCTINSTYYSHPNKGCSTNAADVLTVTGAPNSSGAFNPTPNWIPGLGRYLNPIHPVEGRYVDKDGGDAGFPSFDSVTGAPTNSTRTLSYKLTATGYQINAKLERSNTVFSVSK